MIGGFIKTTGGMVLATGAPVPIQIEGTGDMDGAPDIDWTYTI